MRPPAVSLYFFAGVVVVLIYGVYATHAPAPPAMLQEAETVTVIAEEPASKTGTLFPDFTWRFNALDPGVPTALTAAASFNPADDYWGLPRDDGVDLVAGYCAACHSLRIVMQQHASEARWRELMLWMIEKQGMAPPPDDDLETIIRYLSDHFGA